MRRIFSPILSKTIVTPSQEAKDSNRSMVEGENEPTME